MIDLLDAAKDKLGCVTDSELAFALGVSASRISNYRNGRALPNAWMARRIAGVLKTQAVEVLARIRRERERRQRAVKTERSRHVNANTDKKPKD